MKNVSIPEVNVLKNSSTLAVPINLTFKLGFVSVNGPTETYFVHTLSIIISKFVSYHYLAFYYHYLFHCRCHVHNNSFKHRRYIQEHPLMVFRFLYLQRLKKETLICAAGDNAILFLLDVIKIQ